MYISLAAFAGCTPWNPSNYCTLQHKISRLSGQTNPPLENLQNKMANMRNLASSSVWVNEKYEGKCVGFICMYVGDTKYSSPL